MGEIISISHGCMVWLEKSVTRVTGRHHEACNKNIHLRYLQFSGRFIEIRPVFAENSRGQEWDGRTKRRLYAFSKFFLGGY